MEAVVTLLGVRGSVPVDGPGFLGYGGGTSCVLVRMGGETIILDAGTGMVGLGRFLREEETSLHLLLTHPHIDHLFGLAVCPIFYDPDYRITIYGKQQNGLNVRKQVEALMSPPLWPVGPESFRAATKFQDLQADGERLGEVNVACLKGAHPGGAVAFRLSFGEKSVVYATDYELDESSAPPLLEFARDCSLLLCDGQYFDGEMERRRGFGHSTWRAAAQLGRDCGAECVRIFHHDPCRTDEELEAVEPLLRQVIPNGAFARRGEEIVL